MKQLTTCFCDIKKSKTKIRDLYKFILSIYSHGKSAEAFSFAVWEVLYSSGLLKKIKFTNELPIVLDQNNFIDIASLMVVRFSFDIYRIECWSMIYLLDDSVGYGRLSSSPFNLYFIQYPGNPKKIYSFQSEIHSIFVSRKKSIFVCLKGGDIYRSTDGGRSFCISLRLSTDESFFLFNSGMTETNNDTLLIGEYGNVSEKKRWKSVAYIYLSNDDGISWDSSNFLIMHGVNKHIHIIKYFEDINAFVIADGDNKKQIWKCYFSDQEQKITGIEWRLINNFHLQTGGYTSVVETKNFFYFGTDYNGGTNFIVESKDCEQFIKSAIPDPYRRSPVLYMSGRLLHTGYEIWAVLHSGVDLGSKSLLMCSRDQGKSWIRVIEYNGLEFAIKICSTSNQMLNDVYFSVTSLSCSNNEAQSFTFKIGDGQLNHLSTCCVTVE